MAGLTERLLQLAAQHEAKAAALRLAASELNGHATHHATTTLPAKLAGAIALRGKKPGTVAGVRAQRERTAELLDRIAASGGTPAPKSIVGRSAAPLTRAGYLQRIGDGYIRTAKPFIVSKDEQRATTAVAKTKSGRPSINALRERVDAVKRPKEFDRSFPRMKGTINEANVSAYEQRVRAYWAER